jgi:hypothetical protein
MGFPKISYVPVVGEAAVTLLFERGPSAFQCKAAATVHDNVSTSGVRERVIERIPLLISFTMPAMRVDDDLADWGAFAVWALQGGEFDFYPNQSLATVYWTCISLDEEWAPARVAAGVYSAAFAWQIVDDELAPGSPGEALERFYGIAES